MSEMEKEVKTEKKERKIMSPEKKKKIRKRIICLIVLALLAVLVVMGVINSRKPMSVSVTTSTIEDMVQQVELSGTIEATQEKAYFAPVGAVLGNVNVQQGDLVKTGDVLYSYDEDYIAQQMTLEDYKLQSTQGSYDNSMQTESRTQYKYSEAGVNLAVLEQQISDFEAYEKELETKIADKKAALAREGTLLQISLIDWSGQPNSDEYVNLQKLVQENQYEQQHNAQIAAWEKELKETQNHLSECKSYESQMKSQKTSSQDSSMTAGAKVDLEARTKMNALESENTLEELAAVKGGILSDIDGIVSEVTAVPGSTVGKGTQLMKIKDLANVIVKVQLSKYDLEQMEVGQTADITVKGQTYTGKVSRISSLAGKNQSGSTVVEAEISLDHPDENIIIGLEAKAIVYTGEAKNAITVPNESLAYDAVGAYVQVVRNGIVTKQPITLGIMGDLTSQVVVGVQEGEHIVAVPSEIYTDGMVVTEIMESEDAQSTVTQ